MKKIHKPISRALPPLRIYRDEIEELFQLLDKVCEDSVEIQTCGHVLDSVDEIPQLPQEETNSISFTCSHPYLWVRLTKSSGEIYCDDAGIDAGIKAEGIVSCIQKILLKGKVTRPFLPERIWLSFIFGLAFASPLLFGISLENAPVTAFGGLSVLGWFLFLIWDYRFKANSFCTVVFKSRKEALGFWKRNKDQAVLILLGAVIGAVIGGGITFLVTLIKD